MGNQEADTREGHGLNLSTSLAQARGGINRLGINPGLKQGDADPASETLVSTGGISVENGGENLAAG